MIYSKMDTRDLLVEFEETVKRSATWQAADAELGKLQALRDEIRWRLGFDEPWGAPLTR